MLSIEGLCFSYGKRPVLQDINFHLKKGELCGLFGPNGTGKTTLFKCCLRFLTPDRGAIRFKGQDIRTFSTKEMARQVAYVPQSHHSPFAFTSGQMVLMGRTPHLNRFFSPSTRDQDLALDAMDRLGIAHLAPTPFDRLSGGQQQMVLIARAIAQEASAIFLDEPAAALDFKNQVNLWEALNKIAEQGTTVLACSHDPNHVSWFCHSTVVLGESGILAKGDPGQVLSQALMDKIYEDACRVKTVQGVKLVVPRGLFPQEERAVQKGTVLAFPGPKNMKGRQQT